MQVCRSLYGGSKASNQILTTVGSGLFCYHRNRKFYKITLPEDYIVQITPNIIYYDFDQNQLTVNGQNLISLLSNIN